MDPFKILFLGTTQKIQLDCGLHSFNFCNVRLRSLNTSPTYHISKPPTYHIAKPPTISPTHNIHQPIHQLPVFAISLFVRCSPSLLMDVVTFSLMSQL